MTKKALGKKKARTKEAAHRARATEARTRLEMSRALALTLEVRAIPGHAGCNAADATDAMENNGCSSARSYSRSAQSLRFTKMKTTKQKTWLIYLHHSGVGTLFVLAFGVKCQATLHKDLSLAGDMIVLGNVASCDGGEER